MKKTLILFFVVMLTLSMTVVGFAAEPIKMGKAEHAAHGTKCFAVAVVALQGDVIVGAYLDEYQMLPRAETVGVPNSDSDFAQAFANPEQALASKKLNDAYYSANMAKAGSTVTIANNFIALEKFVVGKTISELENILTTTEYSAMVDAVSGATVVDSHGYLTAFLLAAKDALNN